MLLPKEKISTLLTLLNERYPLQQEVELEIEKLILPVAVPKNALLIKQGETCDYIYFICEGAFRSFLITNEKDITTWISTDNEFITAISAYFNQSPATKNIEAIEDSFLLAIHRDDLLSLIRKYSAMNHILRIFYEEYFMAAEERAYIARIRDAEGKYKRLLETYPHLIKRVPLKHIASFLGMTLETLSRIRSRLGKEPS
jgi:CRP-like cAMP-binding protein